MTPTGPTSTKQEQSLYRLLLPISWTLPGPPEAGRSEQVGRASWRSWSSCGFFREALLSAQFCVWLCSVHPWGLGLSSVNWQGRTQWSWWSGQAVKTQFSFSPFSTLWWYLFIPGWEWHCCSTWKNIFGISLNVFYFPVLTVPPFTWKYFFSQSEAIRNNDD